MNANRFEALDNSSMMMDEVLKTMLNQKIYHIENVTLPRCTDSDDIESIDFMLTEFKYAYDTVDKKLPRNENFYLMLQDIFLEYAETMRELAELTASNT